MTGLLILCAGCGTHQYVLHNGTWQYENQHGWDGTDVIPLAGVDAATFAKIDEVYGRDARSVYFKGSRLAGADPRSFNRIRVKDRTWYAADAHAVFCNEIRLPDSDPTSFRFLDHFALDRNHVYLGCQILEGADAASFHRDGKFWLDRNHVYSSVKLVRDLNPATLVQHPEGKWVHDDQRICVETSCMRPDDIASFSVVRGSYARDRLSFYAANSGLFPAKMHIADPSTFEIIDDQWARDSKTIYWTGTPLPGANPKTFRILTKAAGMDGGTCYWFGRQSDPRQCR